MHCHPYPLLGRGPSARDIYVMPGVSLAAYHVTSGGGVSYDPHFQSGDPRVKPWQKEK